MSKWIRDIVLSAALASLLGIGGCEAVGITAQSPLTFTREATVGPGKLLPLEIQSQVMSFADTFTSAASQEWNQIGSSQRPAAADVELSTPASERIRRVALEIKISNVSSALAIASGQNPAVAVADMITMVTLQRMALEDPWAAALFGAQNAERAARTYRAQEQAAWEMGRRVLTEPQQAQLRELIEQWRRDNPDQRYVSGVRLETYAIAGRQSLRQNSGGGSLLSLLMLDPLAGLDPATREVQQTRMLAERLFFYSSRMPQVIKWQGQSLAGSLLGEPQVRETVDAVAKVSEAADKVSSLAQQLPAERRAAIDQFFAGLDRQREAVMSDLRDDRGQISGTLGEIRSTVEASRELSDSLAATIAAADQLAARVNPPGDETPPRPEGTPDPMDRYESAARQTTAAAEQLTALIGRVDALLNSGGLDRANQSVQATATRFEQSGQRMVDQIFWRALTLIVIAPFAIAAAGILYRKASEHQRRSPTTHAQTGPARRTI